MTTEHAEFSDLVNEMLLLPLSPAVFRTCGFLSSDGKTVQIFQIIDHKCNKTDMELHWHQFLPSGFIGCDRLWPPVMCSEPTQPFYELDLSPLELQGHVFSEAI